MTATNSKNTMTSRDILVFGGNGFIGFESVLALLESQDWSVTLINRGKSWDWDKEDLIKAKVRCITWDRKKDISECEDFQAFLETIHKFHAVLDFSGFSKRQVRNTLPAIVTKTRLYIYMSTDSVYEVCCKSHNGPTIESDVQRPNSSESIKALKRQDSYGHKKLRCEEYLHKYLDKTNVKYVMLRLADVIGPRDGTDRFWQYQMWVKLAMELDVSILVPKSIQDLQLSLVFVKDIAKIVVNILVMDDGKISKLSGHAFNLACKETVDITGLLNLMCASVKKSSNYDSNHATENKPLSVEYCSSNDIPHIYPSVEKGPISIEKAMTELGWNATSLQIAVSETCQFYEAISHHQTAFMKQKRTVAKELFKDIKNLYPSHISEKMSMILGL